MQNGGLRKRELLAYFACTVDNQFKNTPTSDHKLFLNRNLFLNQQFCISKFEFW